MSRMFVICARDVPEAVILRRGPSEWYHVIGWDLARDRFTHGAWIKGRIYEEKCDLSPDGRLLVYFVHQGSRVGTKFTDSWTAVSRMPWLEALVAWPQGTTYGGGGRFVGPRELSVRACTDRVILPPQATPPIQTIQIVEAPAPLHASAGLVLDADWSGHDHKQRVIFTRGGGIYRREKREDILLADFTDLTPDPQPAPEWASRPL